MVSKHYKKIIVLALFFILLSFNSAIGSVSEEKKKEILNKVHLLQIPFIENKGQIEGEKVKYYAKTLGGTVFITEGGEIVYSLPEKSSGSGVQSLESGQASRLSERILKGISLKEELVDGKINEIKGEDEAITKVSYFRGRDRSNWKSNISTYNLVSLGEVYKGIELKLKAYGNNVEKLFYVKPDADPEEIRLKIEGAKGIKVNEKGELELNTELEVVRFTKPIAYQEINGKRVEVAVEYSLLASNPVIPSFPHSGLLGDSPEASGFAEAKAKGGEGIFNSELPTLNSEFIYGFKVGAYNKGYPLIIDPLLASTFIEGNNHEIAYALAIDSSGNIFVAGWTDSSDYPTILGAYDTSYNGATDVFISKFDNSLTDLLASTFIGGSNNDNAKALGIDSSGNVFITGETYSSDYPTTSGAYDTTINGPTDAFVSKLNSSLTTLLASTYISGSDNEYGNAIALDSSGNVLVTGRTASSDYPTISGAYDTTINGDYDVFISKLNSGLTTLLASAYIGGSGDEYGIYYDYSNAIALDSSGNIFITGETYSSDYPTTSGAYDTTFSGDSDVFVSKLNSGLTTLLASTYIGGSSYAVSEYGNAIVLDSSGNVLVTGRTASSDYPTTSGAYDTTINGYYDVFVSKLNSSLTTLLASTYIGGDDYDSAYAVAIDSSGNVLVTGGTASSDYPTTSGAYDTTINGPTDAFVSKLNSSLTTLLASTYIGGNYYDYSNAIAFDSSGNVFVAGGTLSSDYPTTSEAYDTSSEGYNYKVFVSKLELNLFGVFYTLWQNQSTGDIVFWQMDGTTVLSQSLIGNVPDTNWKIVDYADFNQDGKSDILWQNQATGDVCIWLMDGTTLIGVIPGGGVSDPYWRITSAVDYSGDGKPDYLWQHQQRGDLYTWFIDWNEWWGSIVVTGGTPSGGVSDTDWKIIGTGDFNSDGNSDYLWQHQARGDIYIWFTNGYVPTSESHYIPARDDINWKIVAIADFNNDGKPDILWRHQVNGQNEVWFMDGVTYSGSASIQTVSDTNWRIGGPK